MKKGIVKMMLLLTLAFVLSACGNQEAENAEKEVPETAKEAAEESGKTKLTGMVWGSTENHEEMTRLLFEARPELAEKYEVEWVVGGKGDEDIAEKIRLALSANEPVADFVQLNYTQIPEFAEAGVLEDTGSYIEAYKDQLVEGAVVLTKYKDQTVTFPFELKPRIWFYRADIFEEAGVLADQIKSTADLIEAGKKIQEIYPDSYIWNLGKDAPAYSFYMTLSGSGADFSDEAGNYQLSEDKAVRTMLEEYKQLVDSGVVSSISDWTTDWENALNDGTLVSQLSAGWLAQNSFLPTYASNQEGKWKAAAWPHLAGADSGSDGGGSVFAIPAFSKNPKAAGEFLAELTLSKEGSKVIFDVIAATPVNIETLALEEVKKPDPFFGESLYEAQLEALNNYKIFNYSPKAGAESTIVTEYFIKAVYGELTIDEALAKAQTDLETMVGNAYE